MLHSLALALAATMTPPEGSITIDLSSPTVPDRLFKPKAMPADQRRQA